jgi:hypothetical protein
MSRFMRATLLLLLTAFSAAAAEITGETKCAAMAQAFDTENLEEVQQFSRYVLQTMHEIDQTYIRRSERSLMRQLSEDGRRNMMPATSVNCRSHPA